MFNLSPVIGNLEVPAPIRTDRTSGYEMLLLALLLMFAHHALGAENIRYHFQSAMGDEIWVGIPTQQIEERMRPQDFGRQRSPNWCWAATAQMILQFFNFDTSQEAIVNQAYGGLFDVPGGIELVNSYLTHQIAEQNPSFRSFSSVLFVQTKVEPESVYAWLRQGQPLFAAMIHLGSDQSTGHTRVVTAGGFSRDPAGRLKVGQVVLRDPEPAAPTWMAMSWEDFVARTRVLARLQMIQ